MVKAPRQTSRQLRTKKEIAGEDPIDKKLEIENTELALGTGTVTKDKVYYKKLAAAVESKRQHPRHFNIKMQAHHIISENAVKLAGKQYIDELLLLGYNINDLENLAFIPSTLQGACHLGIQPHIGNHSARALADESSGDAAKYSDDAHPLTYHEMVKRKLMYSLDNLRKECPSSHPDAQKNAKADLNTLSHNILTLIDSFPRLAPLTNAYRAFSDFSKVGCGGQVKVIKSIFEGDLHNCPVQQDHSNNRHGEHQRDEGINCPKPNKYQLVPGS